MRAPPLAEVGRQVWSNRHTGQSCRSWQGGGEYTHSTDLVPYGRKGVNHKQDHIPLTLRKAHDAEEIAHADTLLDQVRHLQGPCDGHPGQG